MAVQEDDVLPLQNIERLSGITVDVHRRPEARGLVRLQQRERPARLAVLRLDRHLEPAQVDQPALTRPQHKRRTHSFTHYTGPPSAAQGIIVTTPNR